MNQNLVKQKKEKDQDVLVKKSWEELLNNKSDEIEDTFCYKLFENNYFDENLFFELCKNMEIVLLEKNRPKKDYTLLVWIISCIFRSVFSHLDKFDLYKIKNYDLEISANWSNEHLEKLRNLLEKVFFVLSE